LRGFFCNGRGANPFDCTLPAPKSLALRGFFCNGQGAKILF